MTADDATAVAVVLGHLDGALAHDPLVHGTVLEQLRLLDRAGAGARQV